MSAGNSSASRTAGAAELDVRIVGHDVVGQRPDVLHDVALRAEHRQDPNARLPLVVPGLAARRRWRTIVGNRIEAPARVRTRSSAGGGA